MQGVHVENKLAPDEEEYVPKLQAIQVSETVAPGTGEYVPGWQLMHWDDAMITENVPAAHCVQVFDMLAPMAAE